MYVMLGKVFTVQAIVSDYHEHTCRTNNSYIPQMEQHEHEGNVPYLLA